MDIEGQPEQQVELVEVLAPARAYKIVHTTYVNKQGIRKPRTKKVYRTHDKPGRPAGTGWAPSQADIDSVTALKAQGKTLKEIGAATGLKANKIAKILRA